MLPICQVLVTLYTVSSRFGSEPPSVEDDVDVWRYAIVSCMPETTTILTLTLTFDLELLQLTQLFPVVGAISAPNVVKIRRSQ